MRSGNQILWRGAAKKTVPDFSAGTVTVSQLPGKVYGNPECLRDRLDLCNNYIFNNARVDFESLSSIQFP